LSFTARSWELQDPLYILPFTYVHSSQALGASIWFEINKNYPKKQERVGQRRDGSSSNSPRQHFFVGHAQ